MLFENVVRRDKQNSKRWCGETHMPCDTSETNGMEKCREIVFAYFMFDSPDVRSNVILSSDAACLSSICLRNSIADM